MSTRPPLLKHMLRTLRILLESGESGSHRRVLLANSSSSYHTYLTALALGVGTTMPDERDDDEGEEPEELADDAWKKLLDCDEDGVLSLKLWEEVTELKANKTNIALALREIMRQAWGEYILFS